MSKMGKHWLVLMGSVARETSNKIIISCAHEVDIILHKNTK